MAGEVASSAPATPGGYLRQARKDAGLTVGAIARATVSSPVDVSAAYVAITRAEADQELLDAADLARVANVISFSPTAYLALAGRTCSVSPAGAP